MLQIVYSTKKGFLIGFQGIYQHLVEKHKTMTSSIIKGTTDLEDCCKDILQFDEGEYAILVSGTFNKCIGIFIMGDK